MRIFDIIKSELHSDKLRSEEELERVLNNKNLETDDKVATIKELLKKIAISEASFNKFENLVDEPENNEE